MKLLFHVCCAPCANAPIALMRTEGVEVTALWYNPNIHPLLEYRSRRDTLVAYTQAEGIPLILEDGYGLRPFVQAVAGDIEGRCPYCYRDRLGFTAKKAKEEGFDGFSASLLISPYQNHQLLKDIGEELAETYGIPFYYQDFRPLFREGQSYARSQEFYMQKYCGCVFSEEERYTKKPKKNPETTSLS